MYPPLRIKVLLRTPKGRVRALGRATDGEPPPRRMTRLRGLWTILGEVHDVEERDELALVATTIQVHFAHAKARERALVEFMAGGLRWPAPPRPTRPCGVRRGLPSAGSPRPVAGRRSSPSSRGPDAGSTRSAPRTRRRRPRADS